MTRRLVHGHVLDVAEVLLAGLDHGARFRGQGGGQGVHLGVQTPGRDHAGDEAETLRLLGTEMPQGGTPAAAGAAPSPQQTPSKGGEKKSKTPALDHFCRDLTQLAGEGQLDPTIGRAKEIERVMEVLTRRKKNNPVLIGEPGVGKTAIVEGLAQLDRKSVV